MDLKSKTSLKNLPKSRSRNGWDIIIGMAEVRFANGKGGVYYISGKDNGSLRLAVRVANRESKRHNESYLEKMSTFELSRDEIIEYRRVSSIRGRV